MFNLIFLIPIAFANKFIVLAWIIFTPVWLIFIDLIDVYKYVQNHNCLLNAIDKLESNNNLIVIGITGSNGKTSVKEILFKLLSNKYKVIATKKNQNTPKGAINTINSSLTADTEIFICEMGARCKGDISEMCNLVNPTKAIITSVSPQHLETFKTEKNIYLTKKELPDYIKDNYCVYNIDNQPVNQMYMEKSGNKGCISIKNAEADLYATNIHTINYQTYFDINYDGTIYPCHTHLLGEHNVTNILLALNMALHLGVDINSAIQTIISLQPTPHRLEYIKSHIDIIDDSYNCSIDSAQMALKVLSQTNKIKAVCTPGIIEGGKMQTKLNEQLSSILNNIADISIIVGKTNRKALISRLSNFELVYIETNNLYRKLFKSKSTRQTDILKLNIKDVMPSNKKRAYIVDTLKVAKLLFAKLLNNNHILLLLNDLPDEYN